MLTKQLQNLRSSSWMIKLLLLSLATSLAGILTHAFLKFVRISFLADIELFIFWCSTLSFVGSFLCSFRLRPNRKQFLISISMVIPTLALLAMYIYPPWIILYPSEDNPTIKYGFRWDPPSPDVPMLDGVYELVGLLWPRSFILLIVSSAVILIINREKIEQADSVGPR
jgi:hypothetical protein